MSCWNEKGLVKVHYVDHVWIGFTHLPIRAAWWSLRLACGRCHITSISHAVLSALVLDLGAGKRAYTRPKSETISEEWWWGWNRLFSLHTSLSVCDPPCSKALINSRCQLLTKHKKLASLWHLLRCDKNRDIILFCDIKNTFNLFLSHKYIIFRNTECKK